MLSRRRCRNASGKNDLAKQIDPTSRFCESCCDARRVPETPQAVGRVGEPRAGSERHRVVPFVSGLMAQLAAAGKLTSGLSPTATRVSSVVGNAGSRTHSFAGEHSIDDGVTLEWRSAARLRSSKI